MNIGKRFTIDPKTRQPVQIVVASDTGRRSSEHLFTASPLGRRIIVKPEATTTRDKVLADRAAAPPPQRPWLNPDVHARTPEMRAQLLAEFPELPTLTQNRANVPGEIERVMNEIRVRDMPPEALACLDKIYRRRGAIDKDLAGVSVAGLLCVVWSDCVHPKIGAGSLSLFTNTLVDMGLTCVQGDSHRLFAAYAAYKRDEIDLAKMTLQKFENPPVYKE